MAQDLELSSSSSERQEKALDYYKQWMDLSTEINNAISSFRLNEKISNNDLKQKIKSLNVAYLKKIENM